MSPLSFPNSMLSVLRFCNRMRFPRIANRRWYFSPSARRTAARLARFTCSCTQWRCKYTAAAFCDKRAVTRELTCSRHEAALTTPYHTSATATDKLVLQRPRCRRAVFEADSCTMGQGSQLQQVCMQGEQTHTNGEACAPTTTCGASPRD